MTARLFRLWSCLAALLTLGLPVLTFARPVGSPVTINVPTVAYPTIQSGVDAASPYNGDTVLVADGTYTGDGNRDIDFHGKNITVTSQNGPAKTIIDCGGYASTDGSGNHRGFYLHSGETAAVISGFTIKNGVETDGGGILDTQGSTIMLTSCVFTQNHATDGGGGFENEGTATLIDCTFSGNSGTNGGGGVGNFRKMTLMNCIFTQNSSDLDVGNGGGFENNGSASEATLTNCAFMGNSAGGGGGLDNFNGAATLKDCVFTRNNAGDGGGLENSGTFSVTNCTFTANTAQYNGGGINNSNNGGTTTLTNCTLTANTAEYGGGIENDNSGGTTVLTNCTITGNSVQRYGGALQQHNGGGIYNNNYSGTITLTNCTVSGNTAQSSGGGIYNDNSNSGMITLINCIISANTAQGSFGGGDGGGVFNYNGNGGATILTNCAITANTAHYGGGVSNYNGNGGATILTNCAISANTAKYDQGGEGGGVSNYSDKGSTATLTNCTISANSAYTDGGGVYADTGGGGTITLTNCVVYGDTDVLYGDTDLEIVGCIVTYSDVQGGYSGSGNINTDPLFVNAAAGDLHLKPNSPCLGRGIHIGAPATDKDGRTRPSPPSMGAYELPVTLEIPDQYPTIQSAIVAAHSSDTVIVAAGTYTGPGNVDWDFGGKDVTVKSADGAANTIIDCGGKPSADGSGNHRGFYLHSGETNAVIDGITIKNGYESYVAGVADSGYGGSICVDGSGVSIKNCVFTGSTATKGGGGVAIIGKGHHSITLTNCVFTKNTAPNGGGVYSNNDSGTIALTNCTVSGNTASNGGGVFNQNSQNSGAIALTGCSVSGNTAQDGGGVYNENDTSGDTITLINCSVSGNAAPFGGGIYDFNSSSDDTILLINDIVYGDSGSEITDNALTASATSITFSDIQGGHSGTGNIDVYPLFVDAAAGDLRLKLGSPCTGKGTPDGAPATDKDGNKRPNPPSMGAYEPTGVLAKTAGITAVYMISSHELDVDVATVSTVPLERFVALDMTINGQPVHVSEKVYFGNPLDNPHSFIIDLKKAGVHRFRDNQRFTITETYQDNGTSRVEDKADGIILLPVVVIPGIGPLSGTIIGELMNDDHPGGGPGTFPGFENYLTNRSLNLVKISYGDGYSTFGLYQTLYTLTYVRNIASFSDGAQALANQINTIVSQTYANRVNIVTHSKGGLITRQYLTNLGNNASNTVKRIILTVPPNLGSPLAVAGKVVNHEYDYHNLTPLYPWFRRIQGLGYIKLPPNPELNNLNQQRLPSGIDYSLIYSRAFNYPLGYTTPETFTAVTIGLFSSHFAFDEGDGVVPWFSQLGLQFDPNNPKKTPALIPAFVDSNGQPIITDEKEVTSFHSAMLDNPDAQSYIFDKLTGDIK